MKIGDSLISEAAAGMACWQVYIISKVWYFEGLVQVPDAEVKGLIIALVGFFLRWNHKRKEAKKIKYVLK